MVMRGETLATGGNPKCGVCGITPELKVYRTPAGWYIGTRCNCGPYSRESNYYKTESEAQKALDSGRFGR